MMNLPMQTAAWSICLYVEDSLTAAYLSELFLQDSKLIRIIPVGSRHSVVGMVSTSRGAGAANSFGFVDCDFGTSNTDAWNDVNTFVFRSDVHEVENYALDFEAMAGCEKSNGIGEESFSDKAKSSADNMLYAVSCDKVISDLHAKLGEDFPHQPRPSRISSEEDACAYLLESKWCQSFASRMALIAEDSVREQIHEAVGCYSKALKDGSWMKVFPGKEILREVCQKLYHGDVSVRDFVVSIARAQNRQGLVPRELLILLSILKQRVFRRGNQI